MPKKPLRKRDGRSRTQKPDFAAEYRRRRLLRATGFALMAVGGVMAAVHIYVHLADIQFMKVGLQDLVAGWPMAAVIFIAGAIMAGQRTMA